MQRAVCHQKSSTTRPRTKLFNERVRMRICQYTNESFVDFYVQNMPICRAPAMRAYASAATPSSAAPPVVDLEPEKDMSHERLLFPTLKD